ncbi:MAG: hypothetical protein ABIH66_01420 [bacterium]
MNGEPRAYREMGKTCKTRPIEAVRLEWVPMPPLEDEFPGHTWGFVSEKETGAVAEVWKTGYPELTGTTLDFIFHPERYAGKVLLAETYETDRFEREFCMFRCENGKEIIAAMLLRKDDTNRQVELTIGTILPQHRNVQGMFVRGFPKVVEWRKRTGAEYLTSFCVTWPDRSPRLLEANGFRLCGIFPGQLVRWTSGGRQYRGCTVQYYRFIGEGADFSTKREEWSLSPRAARLWETLEEINGGDMFRP